jgi:subtilisin family serine protease
MGRDLWINRLDIDSSRYIPYWPYVGAQQVVAVIDDGVYRNHPDLNNLLAIGVDTWHRKYRVRYGGGAPNYWDSLRRKYTSHGTGVAGILNATTHNSIGVASCAPGASILPIRLKVNHLNSFGVPQYRFWGTFSKAIRALRFQFAHGKWAYKVRVVNMSFGGNNLYSWWWQVKNPKWNLSRDLARNDRLYVASAGNDGLHVRRYPAAHSNVLGVTGLFCMGEGQYSAYSGSNWYYDNTYPISGIFSFTEGRDYAQTTSTPYYEYPQYQYYDGFGGTSAAAPQVSALAYHLYSHRPNVTYQEVWYQIKESRDKGTDQGGVRPMAGILDFDKAITTWWD